MVIKQGIWWLSCRKYSGDHTRNIGLSYEDTVAIIRVYVMVIVGGYVVVIIRRIFNGYHVGIASGYRTGVWVLSWNHNWICIHYVYMSNA